MNDVKEFPSQELWAKSQELWARSQETWRHRKFFKTPCLTRDVQEKLNTETLDVPGVEVVETTEGKAFAGPFYSDQIELLRETLRGMPRREKHVVVNAGTGAWIHRKP